MTSKPYTVLGIESSCDETSFAVLRVSPNKLKLERHVVASQVKLHAQYGGVVPEVAARQHIEVLLPLLEKSIGKRVLSTVDLLAVTSGPGLITSLMVGVQAAKSISYLLRKPLIGINHLEAHMYANWLSAPELVTDAKKFFPALVLIVSGGHTEFVLMRGHGTYTLLGQTVDDAAGESFDKVAKILDLGYPGGPIIGALALNGNPAAIDFPRPMLTNADYNVSFSGLKTAVLYYLERRKQISKAELPDIAASFQRAVTDVLIGKLQRACEAYSPRSIMLAGGVSANAELRTRVQELGARCAIPAFVPELQYTGDNAAMIAVTGYYRRRQATKAAWRNLTFDPHMRLV